MTPSTEQPRDLASRYVDLARSAARTQWRLARAAVRAADTATRQGSPRAAASAYVRTAGREAGRWWREAAALGLDYGSALVELNREAGDRVVRAVAGAPAARVEVRLVGAPGETARARVDLVNRRDTPVQVGLDASPLAGADGAEVEGAWRTEPAEPLLEPGEEQSVELCLPLAEDLFPTGTAWSGTVALQDESAVLLEVSVAVDVT